MKVGTGFDAQSINVYIISATYTSVHSVEYDNLNNHSP